MNHPSPEEEYIKREDQQDFYLRADLLARLIFKQQDIFDAWFQARVLSNPIAAISRTQNVSFYHVKKRIDTAEAILRNFQSSLRRIDD